MADMLPSQPVSLRYNGDVFVESEVFGSPDAGTLKTYVTHIKNTSLVLLVGILEGGGEYIATVWPPSNDDVLPYSDHQLQLAAAGTFKLRAWIGRGGSVDIVLLSPVAS